MKKTLLIIGAGDEACEGIKTAKKMGLTLVVADANAQAPGFAMADHRLVVSTYDHQMMVAKALELKQAGIIVDGVIAMCADVPLTVAKVAEKLNLPGLSVESALWVSNKLLMKQRLQSMGIAIPKFCAIDRLTEFKQVAKNLDLPFVIKPVDSRGARGVQLIKLEHQYQAAYDLAEQESPSSMVMAEQYLAGPQISTETLIDNGKHYTLGFCDRNYEWLERTKPFIIENGGDSPSALAKDQQQQIIDAVEAAAKALNINCGVAKGDMVMTSEGAKVIEIAGRLSGGYFSTTQIPMATGIDFVANAILLALGESLTEQQVTATSSNAVAIRYLDLRAGTVATISGFENASKSAGVKKISLLLKPGDSIEALSNHTQRSGFVITQADTKQQAVDYAYDALSKIVVNYES